MQAIVMYYLLLAVLLQSCGDSGVISGFPLGSDEFLHLKVHLNQVEIQVCLLNLYLITGGQPEEEPNHYRQKKLFEITEECIRFSILNKTPGMENIQEEEIKGLITREEYEKLNDKTKKNIKTAILDQIKEFYMSPYENDKRFAVSYIAQVTRENFGEKELVDNMFFYMIFDNIFDSNDEKIIVKSYEALCNLTQDDETRKKLTKEDYYKRIYESINVYVFRHVPPQVPPVKINSYINY